MSRRQKPTAQREQDGSRKRPWHHEQPTIDGALVAPSRMSEAQREYWDYFAPLLSSARMVGPGDREALRLYCVALVQVDEILALQSDEDYRRVLLSVTVDGAGNEKPKTETNPLDVQLRNWLEVARHHQAELGLSPTSRTKVHPLAEPERPKSALSALQAQAGAQGIRRVK